MEAGKGNGHLRQLLDIFRPTWKLRRTQALIWSGSAKSWPGRPWWWQRAWLFDGEAERAHLGTLLLIERLQVANALTEGGRMLLDCVARSYETMHLAQLAFKRRALTQQHRERIGL